MTSLKRFLTLKVMSDQIQDAIEIIPEPIQPYFKKSIEQPKHHAPKTRILSKLRRHKLIEAALDGKPLKEVAISTGLSPKTAENQAIQILREPNVKKAFISILEEKGVTDIFLAEKTKALLDAKKTEYFQKDGIVTDEREVDALETQRKTLELATKLKGHLKERSEGDINIGLMQMVVQAVKGGEE